ncbi:MAG: hypothetical protein HPY55_03115 [Firmicutes bacterium]|nr:hypothetical protein [Bacillota bacterium]
MYWERAGAENTVATIEAAYARAREMGIKHVVVASTCGPTARKALELLPREGGIKLIVVAHHSGFDEPGKQQMPAEIVSELRSKGVPVLITTHLFGGVDRAVANKFGGQYVGGLIAYTLRMFGQGTKVCVEIATMALDAGLVPYGEEIIAVGGSSNGADTALVVRPAHAKSFFDGQVLEVICKPRDPSTE